LLSAYGVEVEEAISKRPAIRSSLQKRAPVGSANMWVAAALSMRFGSLWAARSSFERIRERFGPHFAL